MPVSDRTSLSRWLFAGTPSAVALGVLGMAVMHAGFKIPWKAAMAPVAALVGIEIAYYIAMYWIRNQFLRTRDLRIGVMVGGIFCLVLVLIGLRYAEKLGIASRGTFSANYIPFSIFMVIVIVISVILCTFWRPL